MVKPKIGYDPLPVTNPATYQPGSVETKEEEKATMKKHRHQDRRRSNRKHAGAAGPPCRDKC